jgi:hypothetical protein
MNWNPASDHKHSRQLDLLRVYASDAWLTMPMDDKRIIHAAIIRELRDDAELVRRAEEMNE